MIDDVSSELVRKLLLTEENVYNRLEFYIHNPINIDSFKKYVNSKINENSLNFYSISWKDKNSSLMNALKVEKNVMFLILSLIISGLIIFVKEKNKDIGILKTLGFTNISILKIFTTIGITIGLIGAITGTIFGVLFTKNIKFIQSILENLLETKLFAEEIYFLSSLPSEIKYEEVGFIFIISVIITILSAIFPALRASKLDPIKILKNE